MVDSTNPRVMADNIRELSANQAIQGAELEALGTYSETEIDTGKKWIDGSTIYRKVYTIEAFPNTTSLSFAHGIANLGFVTALYGVAFIDPGVAAGKMFIGSGNPSVLYAASTIVITTSSDMSGHSGFVVIEYTKAPAGLLAPNPDDMRTIEPEEPINEEPKKEEK